MIEFWAVEYAEFFGFSFFAGAVVCVFARGLSEGSVAFITHPRCVTFLSFVDHCARAGFSGAAFFDAESAI